MKNKKIVILIVLALAAAAAFWYWPGAKTAAPQAAKGGREGQPPTVVNVVSPARRDVPVVLSASGTVAPVQSVALHPQTTSTIRKVHIKEGQYVKAGQLMFSLDDRSQEANVDKARAQIARERAALADLERQYQRSEELFEQKFIARSALDTLRSQVEAARAALGAGSAALAAERVAASYGTIRAPMAGRVGAIDVHPGSLVQPATLLTTVTQLDPVNVAFTLPESALADLLAAQRQGQVPVQASVGETAQPVLGKLSFIDNTVDPQAGTIRVKALFDNGEERLWPGQYATVRVTLRTLRDAVVIPQSAIITNTRGTSVYVVADGAALSKPVSRVHVAGTDAVVTGLNGNEQVITEGKQNLRPGGKVRLAQAPAPSRETP
ncbi:efflux RND transporter periplasmic adaptor subunit [Massilia sp. PAMC28688]|uniref:efflux RND transporter periplasmic adaptor subunit n=1 Tax=Massilia sp. PAMC28688 TaxID=2861283 RepID=UPI001C62BABB|nr:efflux RND transporter periplasmic adaptor subunit [Massilia sp. PAMC28688]QYF94790.1 efflux RND transporter periplasmic adaptor subunit [Massilia sp. PAMC28688]